MTDNQVRFREDDKTRALVKAVADLTGSDTSKVHRALLRQGLHYYGLIETEDLDLNLGAKMMNMSREEVLSAAFPQPNGGDDEL